MCLNRMMKRTFCPVGGRKVSPGKTGRMSFSKDFPIKDCCMSQDSILMYDRRRVECSSFDSPWKQPHRTWNTVLDSMSHMIAWSKVRTMLHNDPHRTVLNFAQNKAQGRTQHKCDWWHWRPKRRNYLNTALCMFLLLDPSNRFQYRQSHSI